MSRIIIYEEIPFRVKSRKWVDRQNKIFLRMMKDFYKEQRLKAIWLPFAPSELKEEKVK